MSGVVRIVQVKVVLKQGLRMSVMISLSMDMCVQCVKKGLEEKEAWIVTN